MPSPPVSNPPPVVADLNRKLVVVFADTADALADTVAAIHSADAHPLQRASDRLTEAGAEGSGLAVQVDELAKECRDTG